MRTSSRDLPIILGYFRGPIMEGCSNVEERMGIVKVVEW